MKFSFATIHVADLEVSIRFYEEVIGLKVARRFAAGPTKEIAFMAETESRGSGESGGGAEIELIWDKGQKPRDYGEYPSLGLVVKDLDQAMERVKKQGVQITAGPIQPNPNTRFFFIHDPDGVNLEIIEQN